MARQKNEVLKDLRKKIEESENKYKRALADYQNLVKRTERERREYLKFANTSLIVKFLEILDDLEKLSEHLKDQGLNLLLKKFYNFLTVEGVEEIKAKGEKFDPNFHECLEVIQAGNKKMVNRVIEEIRKGYRIGDRVIRHTQVRVGKKEILPETELVEKEATFGNYA
jgi:molecular chaperone GrpE